MLYERLVFNIDYINTISLGMHLSKHGEAREGEYNFWVAILSTVLGLGLTYMAIKTGF